MIKVPHFSTLHKAMSKALLSLDRRLTPIMAYEASMFAWLPIVTSTRKWVWLRRYVVYGEILQMHRQVISIKCHTVTMTDHRRLRLREKYISWQKNTI